MDMIDDKPPSVFSLTHLTGKKSSGNRRVIIQGFDIQWRVFVIVAVGFLPCVIVTAIVWIFLGQMSLLTFPVFYFILFYLIEGRSRDGLKLRRYQAMKDKKNATTGHFYLCGREIDPVNPLHTTLRPSTVARAGAGAGYSLIDDIYGVQDPVQDPYSTHAPVPSRRKEIKAQQSARAEEERAIRKSRYEKAQANKQAQKDAIKAKREQAAEQAKTSGRPQYATLSAADLASAADPFAEL